MELRRAQRQLEASKREEKFKKMTELQVKNSSSALLNNNVIVIFLPQRLSNIMIMSSLNLQP